jgi:hypothetical protein
MQTELDATTERCYRDMLERARSVMAQQLRLGDVILRRRTPNSSRRLGSELPRREARRGTSASTSPPNIR